VNIDFGGLPIRERINAERSVRGCDLPIVTAEDAVFAGGEVAREIGEFLE
jgi:hypothetical protein